MTKINAVAYEDIPANRLLVLKGAGNDPELDANKIYIKVAEEGIIPDFVSRKELPEGEEVEVSIKGDAVWAVEASEEIRPGTSVGVTGGGKLKFTRSSDKYYVGYSIEGGRAGDVIQYVRQAGVTSHAFNTVDGEQE